MKKGILFTTDTVLGMIAVFSAIAIITVAYQNNSGNTIAFETARSKTIDASTTAFYFHKQAGDTEFQEFKTTIEPNAKQAYCAHYYKYTPQKNSEPSNPEEKKFCDSQ